MKLNVTAEKAAAEEKMAACGVIDALRAHFPHSRQIAEIFSSDI